MLRYQELFVLSLWLPNPTVVWIVWFGSCGLDLSHGGGQDCIDPDLSGSFNGESIGENSRFEED